MSNTQDLAGPDLARGIPLSQLRDGGMLAGHAFGQAVMLARRGDEVFAVGATCTHYGGPLTAGVLVGDTVRCPWHHACFSLRTGEAVRAPALQPLPRYAVERRGDMVVVTGEAPGRPAPPRPRREPASVVIVGAGAAGDSAADTLRREGYEGPITLIGEDADAPYDRPNISKDYLAGNAPEEWIPLRPAGFYAGHGIELLTGRSVTGIGVREKRVTLRDGRARTFDNLLIATGASPIRLPPAVDPERRVLYLRSLADSRAIIARTQSAREAVVLGASFIGLEVASSLRSRGLAVRVVAPEARPLERVMGTALSEMIHALHVSRGVVFHLGRTAARVDESGVTLDDGTRLGADLVVAGIGVRPNDGLAAAAGLAADRGIPVNRFMETTVPGIFAAGDVARFPDARTGEPIRVEHWAVAQRQGRAAAMNMLGAAAPFDSAPFFWSAHYDVQISYVGHAARWDAVRVDGDVGARDASVTFLSAGRPLAVATVGRDRASLEAELAME